ncbi:glycerol-3-phosphate 1-O-acyltransferase PlsY [Tumebacillus permanentifrigoris]|uniref:Glycerol-3-phosphate acyltransferase n=1 Tax=Tumebacillus permanentifrigoris TaxID=378543 RepID=A0A316D7H0_9BACL|nr:glycerol-3-phosphate 1-O-acyltransferase PlsY [Tumebacillus permanentifrigoris]PWK11249.1 acyl-phosphate glycerol-3-phosphate acyltransferase [Tumebacillus permanentifrigoris]
MSILILIILGYLIGSFPSALIVGKIGYGVDIREHGSGNLGGTNTFRSIGKTAGIIVLTADILKGSLAAALPFLTGVGNEYALIAGIPAVIGHCYPVFAGFRGGKAVATSAGVLFFVAPLLTLSALVVFVITLYISKYVSLSSILAALWAHTYAIIWSDKPLAFATFLLVVFILYRHRQNLERIMDGSERKVGWI